MNRIINIIASLFLVFSMSAQKYYYFKGNKVSFPISDSILTTRIVVQTFSGADFVFDNNYHLMPLDQLSEYVQQNKHLPEVKSAEEMELDGVTMGEFQIQLLQKVEELTLYILQQQEEINTLKQQIVELKK